MSDFFTKTDLSRKDVENIISNTFPSSITCNLLKRVLSSFDVSFSAAILLVISTQSISSIFCFL